MPQLGLAQEMSQGGGGSVAERSGAPSPCAQGILVHGAVKDCLWYLGGEHQQEAGPLGSPFLPPLPPSPTPPYLKFASLPFPVLHDVWKRDTEAPCLLQQQHWSRL